MAGSISNYQQIQARIDDLYNTAWFQPNAMYPTNLFFTESSSLDVGEAEHSMTSFLSKFVNAGGGNKVTSESNAFKNLNDLISLEETIATKNTSSNDLVLSCLVEISGLGTANVPMDKINGTMQSSKDQGAGSKSSCTLKFLCDRGLKVLQYLQAWQSKWFVQDFEKRSLVSHESYNLNGGPKSGGEGYLGVTNVNISTSGSITALSHLSIFGLIPKSIEGPFKSLGPQSSASGLPAISVTCTYSNAILSFPVKVNSQDKLRFFYFQ